MNLKGIIYIAVIGLILTSCNCETDSESSENKADNTKIEVYDSSVLSIIDTNANFEVLAKGFLWSEGPLWVEDLNSVIFSDVPTNKIFKWNEKDSLSIFLESAGHSGSENKDSNKGPNGLILNKEGQLLICQHGDRRIAILNSDLSKAENDFITVADNYNGKKFNSPNDLVMDQDGNIYFTDPPYGLADNKTGEIGINGVYKINPEKEVSLLVDTLSMPNGIALSLDEKTLYINQSNPDLPVIYSYNINEDGTLSNGIVFYDFRVSSKKMKGLPDGIKTHKSGNLFSTGPGGIHIISPEGKQLALIHTDKATANCALDKDQKYLYTTTTDLLMRLRLK